MSDRADEFLIRAGNSTITLRDFNVALEIGKSAYSHNDLQQPKVLEKAQQRLLAQLTDEAVLLARAAQLGIEVTDAEVDEAAGLVKADYPENTFEQVLLESAVSFPEWKARLKRRLIIEKTVNEDLIRHIEINPDDVSRHFGIDDSDGSTRLLSDDLRRVDKASVDAMRRAKSEAVYQEWIAALKQSHKAEINQKLWDDIVGR